MMARGGAPAALTLLSLLLVTLAAAPSAHGQVPDLGILGTQLEVEMVAPESRVVPLGPFVEVPLTVRYTFLELAPSTEATQVTLALGDVPPGLIVTLSPEALALDTANLLPCACTRTVEAQAFVLVSASMEAPSLVALPITVQADAAVNGAYGPSSAEGTANLTVAYASRIEAAVLGPSTLGRPGGTTEEVAVEVTVTANGPTRLTFGPATPTLRGVQVTVPAPIEVVSGDGPARVTYTLALAGGFEAGIVDLPVASAHASDPQSVGDATRAALRIERAPDGAAPGGGSQGGGGSGGTGTGQGDSGNAGGGNPGSGSGSGGNGLSPTGSGAGGAGTVDAGAAFRSSLGSVGDDPASYTVPLVLIPFGLMVFGMSVYSWRRSA